MASVVPLVGSALLVGQLLSWLHLLRESLILILLWWLLLEYRLLQHLMRPATYCTATMLAKMRLDYWRCQLRHKLCIIFRIGTAPGWVQHTQLS